MTRRSSRDILFSLPVARPLELWGQIAKGAQNRQPLPDAPPAQFAALLQQGATSPSQNAVPSPTNSRPNNEASPRLTQAEAEKLAIKNNPRVSVGHLLALAQHQLVRE